MTQGERVRAVRKECGLTLEKFGERIGIKKNSVSQIENGINGLTDQMAKSICREFNVNPDYLMNGTLPMFSDLPETVLDDLCMQYDCDSLDRSIIECYLKLDASERGVIKKYIKDVYDAEAAAELQGTAAVAFNPAASKREIEQAVLAAEAAYEKSLGIAPKKDSTASSTIGGAGKRSEVS